MPFARLQRSGAVEQVASTIRDAILGGDYLPGDPLPSERELAGQFAVNRGTVREALERLDAWGLIETRHGGNTRVRDFLVGAGLQLLPQLVAPGGRLDAGFMRDLLQLRVLLLGFTAGLAAERRDPAGLAELEAVLAAIEEEREPDALQELDWRFFLVLAQAGGNRVLTMVAHMIGEVYRQNRSLFSLLYRPGTFEAGDHRAALAAVRLGDRAAAADAMTRHAERALRLVAP